ncbi:MAG: class I SAM-dependent methyltransferase [Parasporobacterium sp.]|nr:class I SAM-dependent methyltransferase [Parasporobacterium sp.]
MNKADVKEFFDKLAPGWDDGLVKNDAIIATILDNADIREGVSVLDVACGTGVMIPYYLDRGVRDITAIDLSDEMIRIASEKFQGLNGADVSIKFICDDAELADFGRKFDRIVIYNAFPHFTEPVQLLKRLAGLLNPEGTITVAHSMSKKKLDEHHKGSASHVSKGILSDWVLAKVFKAIGLRPYTIISNDIMYQVAAVNNE